MAEISYLVKKKIFQQIIIQELPFGEMDREEGIIPFLKEIWDLKSLKSTDSRFENAEGDIYQHTVRNDDWDWEYLFDDILDLFDEKNSQKFTLFLERVIHPFIRVSEREVQKFYHIIDPLIRLEGYSFGIESYSIDGIPIYTIQEIDEVDKMPRGIAENDIPFFVDLSKTYTDFHKGVHAPPSIFPAFVLAFNPGWNDYSVTSEFHLYYYPEKNKFIDIGGIKIIHKEKYNTDEVIPQEFNFLPEGFCSVGTSISYYKTLKEQFGLGIFYSILYGLRDVAFFSDIQEKFKNTEPYRRSLIRYDSGERLIRQAKFIVDEYDLNTLYNFNYEFSPAYAQSESVQFQFQFSNKEALPNRIYGIIGQNGVGKTQFISKLPVDISQKNEKVFFPRSPLFSQVITVSYSAFDRLDSPLLTPGFNHVYCGLNDSKGGKLTDNQIIERFFSSFQRIREYKRFEKWEGIILNFLETEIYESFIDNLVEDKIDKASFLEVRGFLSSGQATMLYIITEIISHIRYDSILLYDEPETHLHPNAITQLVNSVYDLVEEFESYCIITTHSPLIIRELLSKNVFILEREDSFPSIRKLNIETFGENLTTITDEVFGNKDVPKSYKRILDELVKQGLSMVNILSLLESDSIPLSLNAKLYLQSQLKKAGENEES